MSKQKKTLHSQAEDLGLLEKLSQVFNLTTSRCICCGKELRDSVSVTTGVGPICRKKFLHDSVETTEDMMARALGRLLVSDLDPQLKMVVRDLEPQMLCNMLIWWSAAHLDNVKVVLQCADIVTDLGYLQLGDVLRARNTPMVVRRDGKNLYLHCKSHKEILYFMGVLCRRTHGQVEKAPRKGRFTFGWKFHEDYKMVVFAIMGLGFGNEWITVEMDGITQGHVLKVDPQTPQRVWSMLDTIDDKFANTKPVPAGGTPTCPIMQQGRVLSIKTPRYEPGFVHDIKALPSKDRQWNPTSGSWMVPVSYTEEVKQMVETYFG